MKYHQYTTAAAIRAADLTDKVLSGHAGLPTLADALASAMASLGRLAEHVRSEEAAGGRLAEVALDAEDLASRALALVVVAREGSTSRLQDPAGEAYRVPETEERRGSSLPRTPSSMQPGARDPEKVRSEILELLPQLAITKPARELARRIGILLSAERVPHADEAPPAPTELTYVPEGQCPQCGTVIPQGETICPKCGIREGDPEQR